MFRKPWTTPAHGTVPGEELHCFLLPSTAAAKIMAAAAAMENTFQLGVLHDLEDMAEFAADQGRDAVVQCSLFSAPQRRSNQDYDGC